MRRQEKEITDLREIHHILRSVPFITVAMCRDNCPYLVTVSHGYDADRNCLYFHCAREGKKRAILDSNNRIWGQVIMDMGYVHGKCDQLYISVHVEGRVVFVEDMEEKRHALEIMVRQLEKDPEPVMSEQLNDDSVRRVAIGRIDIINLFGKKSTDVDLSP